MLKLINPKKNIIIGFQPLELVQLNAILSSSTFVTNNTNLENAKEQLQQKLFFASNYNNPKIVPNNLKVENANKTDLSNNKQKVI